MIDLILAQQLLRQGGKQLTYDEIWRQLQTILHQFELDVRLGLVESENGNNTYHLNVGPTPVAWFYIT